MAISQNTFGNRVKLLADQNADSLTSDTCAALDLSNSNIIGVNSIYTADKSDSSTEGIHFYRSATTVDSLWAKDGTLYFTPNRTFGNTSATNYPVLLSKYTNNYYGITSPTGADDVFIRSTTSGFIPYQSGSAGSGHGGLGTPTWYWSTAYIDTIYQGSDQVAASDYTIYASESSSTYYIETDIFADNNHGNQMIYGYIQGNGYSGAPIHVDFQVYYYTPYESDTSSVFRSQAKFYDATGAISDIEILRDNNNKVYFKVTRKYQFSTFKVFIYGHDSKNTHNRVINITQTAPTSIKSQDTIKLQRMSGIFSEQITVKTNATATQQKINLQTLMTWLIDTKQYIRSNANCYTYLPITWDYANNDILQITLDNINYEVQLAGCIIEFWGQATNYQTGQFRLLIHTSPTRSFTLSTGYTAIPLSCTIEYICNGASYQPKWTWASHIFGGDQNNGSHDCDNIKSNGFWYYTSNGPSTTLGASTNDGALYTQAFSDQWVGQIAQDYRNGNLFTRSRKQGSWQSWRKVAYTDDITWTNLKDKPAIYNGETS